MYVISELDKLYGSDKLHSMRILLINAGGLSQRLPSATVMGKLFTPLPYGDSLFQVFDYKMACYLPLLERMRPGYFHAAADTIETFALGSPNCEQFNFEKPGFTAVGHVSSLAIGTGHGVFVLDDDNRKALENIDDENIALLQQCVKVLQKPSVETMRKEGATFTQKSRNSTNSEEKTADNEMVLTDSCFFFSHDIADKLMLYYRANEPLNCEIDSYGDFLQALGPLATIDYTADMRNVSIVEPRLLPTRQDIFHLLKGSPFHIATLKASEFYHLGTFAEYVHHLCSDSSLHEELALGKQSFNHITLSTACSSVDKDGGTSKCDSCDNKDNGSDLGAVSRSKIAGVVMHTVLTDTSVTPADSVIEYSWFDRDVCLESQCVLSNCTYLSNDDTSALDKIHIPKSTFLHSVPIKSSDQTAGGWVTILFGIGDNLKHPFDKVHLDEVTYMGKPLSTVLSCWQLTSDDVFGCDASSQQGTNGTTSSSVSLWQARLFPLAKTTSQSFRLTYELLRKLDGHQDSGNRSNKSDLVSMADIVRDKDVREMMSHRAQLHTTICSNN